MFVVTLRYVKPIEEVDRALSAHRKWLDDNYAVGLFLASGPRQPRTGGVILARAESEEVLRQELTKDPFYSEGIAEYDVIQFTVNRTAPGLFGHLA